MIPALVLIWAATLARIVLTIRSPFTVWRTAYTVALFSVALAITTNTFRSQVDSLLGLGPNSWSLATHVSSLISGGALAIYLASLLQRHPSQRLLTAIGALTPLMVGCQIITWLHAPVHRTPTADVGSVRGGEFYNFSYHAALIVLLVVTSWATARLAASRRRTELASRTGLALISFATAAGALALLMFATRNYAVLHGERWSTATVFSVGTLLILLATTGIGLGTLLFVASPLEALGRRITRRRTLTPIWIRLRDLYPNIRLYQAHQGPLNSQAHLDRMYIEIHDGLRLLPVSSATDPQRAIVEALRTPPEHGVSAATLLRAADHQDQDQLLSIARDYNRQR